tara:strand:+ start:2816 stop:4738 length:1923 start_codon:yes stop_codon:yes gene_type:complete
MPLQKLQFQPGINKETTSYSNEGGWFDCDKVRFRQGFPEKIGGWDKIGSTSFLGSCRALWPWRTLNLDDFLGVGTQLKYYIESGEGYYDITPIRLTTSAGNVTFSATNGSSTITVSNPTHGAVVNDFVTFSGAVGLGGNITAAVLNQEYQIFEVSDSSTYKIIAREVASTGSITVNGQYSPTPVVADGSDTGNGGSSVVGTYQVNVGLDTSVTGNGWGAGAWGRSTWGSAATVDLITDTLRIWTHDNFGEDLIINDMNGGIYYWDASAVSPLTSPAVALSSLAGADLAPTIAKKVIVSDVDRHVIAFGCDPLDNIGAQDPLLIRFSDQENVVDWRPSTTNTAGDLRLGSGSKIVTAIETRQQILVFTDVSLHAMQYIGPPFTFGINMISENITIRSPISVVAVDDTVYWMGKNEFYVYNGGVQTLPCAVKDYVFSDFNSTQAEKCFGAVNSAFSEVWWYYPSANSDNNDRYVVYNYSQNIWYHGNLVRTAWVDRGVNENPIAAGRDGYLYNHEVGFDDGSTNPASPIDAYIESSQFDIGDGDQFSFVRRLIPDITFRNSTAETPTANFTVKARNFPGGAYLQNNSKNVEKTASVPVEQFTQDAHIRLRGRSIAIKVDSSTTGTGWRLGSPRIDVRSDGRR